MSVHEGISCDACGKSNFHSKRFKCLICYDYDLCSKCYEQGETSSNHTKEHPMQCILTPQDFYLYYHGEKYSSNQPQSLTCPFCGDMGLAFPFRNGSSSLNNNIENMDLFQHLRMKHADSHQLHEVICPICASMTTDEPNFLTKDLISHIATDHQDAQVNRLPETGGETSSFLSQSLLTRDDVFSINAGLRGGFQRGSLRIPGRTGVFGRGNVPAREPFIIDTSSRLSRIEGENDPITNLLKQLSTARRLTALNHNEVNTNISSTSSPNIINSETLARQVYEHERLRTADRSHRYHLFGHRRHHQSTPASNTVPSAEGDIFDSIFSSTPIINQSRSSNNNEESWVHITTPQQAKPDQQSEIPPKIKPSSTTSTEFDSSLLRKLCNESVAFSSNQYCSTAMQSSQQKYDFVQNILLSSFSYSVND